MLFHELFRSETASLRTNEKTDSFFYELVRSGTATVAILEKIKDQLRSLTVDEIENLVCDV